MRREAKNGSYPPTSDHAHIMPQCQGPKLINRTQNSVKRIIMESETTRRGDWGASGNRFDIRRSGFSPASAGSPDDSRRSRSPPAVVAGRGADGGRVWRHVRRGDGNPKQDRQFSAACAGGRPTTGRSQGDRCGGRARGTGLEAPTAPGVEASTAPTISATAAGRPGGSEHRGVHRHEQQPQHIRRRGSFVSRRSSFACRRYSFA